MKNNAKGFTLIELLAVITIMGILMLVAIPTISRTIENARKDTFLDTVKQYANATMNMWNADNFQCGEYSSSSVQAGTYYIIVDTSNQNDSAVPQLLEQGGKSAWGQRDIKGIILVAVYIRDETRMLRFYPALVDGIHGVNVDSDDTDIEISKGMRTLDRGDIVMSGASYSIFVDGDGNYKDFVFSADLNGDGDRDDSVDGVSETNGASVLCVER